MSKSELKNAIFELTEALTKATFLAEDFCESYKLDAPAFENSREALGFASQRDNMNISMSILHDYVWKARNMAELLEEGVAFE